MVPGARAPRERQCQAPARDHSELERLRGASQLRRLLAASGRRSVLDARNGSDAQRGRMVGPGGLLRTARDLRAARAARHGARELPRSRAVEPRRLGQRRGRAARRDRLRQPHVAVFPGEDSGALVRALTQGPGRAEPAGGRHLRGGRQSLAVVGRVAPAGGDRQTVVLPGRGPALVRASSSP